MQYHPKLKKAAKEIQDILKKYDIGAVVVLHSPYGSTEENADGTFYTHGYSEYVQRFDPSYSCAFAENGMLRVRARLKEDFAGDKKVHGKKISQTMNMIQHLAKKTGEISLTLFQMEDLLKKHVEIIDDEDGEETDHTQQNN